jgi:hypothetical protein
VRSVNVRLEEDLVDRLRAHARRWEISLSALLSLASELYLQDLEARANQSPIRIRFRARRGPLSKVERGASAEALAAIRARGGRPLGAHDGESTLPAPSAYSCVLRLAPETAANYKLRIRQRLQALNGSVIPTSSSGSSDARE